MAPAIAHFLVGSSLLLYLCLPLLLRYEFPIEHTVWVFPIGGIWGLTPDFHHIALGYSTTLYAFHGSPWVEVFALHYTLDRPGIRALYHESIFASIAVFTLAIASFWVASRYRTLTRSTKSLRGRASIVSVATLLTVGLATVALGVTISVQNLLPAVAALFGRSGVFTGWIIVGVCGSGAGLAWALAMELIVPEPRLFDPLSGASVGCGLGVVVWLGSATLGIPLLSDQSAPVIHWGGLAALLVYGSVFGMVYAILRGAFTASSNSGSAAFSESDTTQR
jgi:hypothetical protein